MRGTLRWLVHMLTLRWLVRWLLPEPGEVHVHVDGREQPADGAEDCGDDDGDWDDGDDADDWDGDCDLDDDLLLHGDDDLLF